MTHDPMCGMYLSCSVCGNGSNKCTCRLIARVREDEREKHADCRCNELEAMAIVDGKYESVAINGQLLERRDVVLDEAREAVAALYKPEPRFYVLEVQNAYDIAALDALAAIDALREE